MHAIACAAKQERPLQREARALQRESGPCSSQLEKSPSSDGDPALPKDEIKKLKGIIEVWLAYSQVCTSYSLMNFGTWICVCSHHPDPDKEHFQLLRSFSLFSLFFHHATGLVES